MKMRLLIRKSHRYVALVVGLQLLFWSVGGLYFSLIPIERIHGDHLIDKTPLPIQDKGAESSCLPKKLVLAKMLEQTAQQDMRRLTVSQSLLMTYVQINSASGTKKYDLCRGEALELLPEATIRKVAEKVARNAGAIQSVALLKEVAADSEYRGGPLPAYRVSFDGAEKLHLYLDARTAAVTSARTTAWRIFDFLWMLHVMDYEQRDNFNHLLLQLFAALAVFTSLSGLLLWWMSRRRRKPANTNR